METLQLWIGALLTLMIFSFLYRDNPFYKFAEHLFVGVSAAYWMVQGFWGQIVPNLLAKLFPARMTGIVEAARDQQPEWHYAIAGILGLILLARLIPPIAWISRWAMAFIIGYTAGTNLTRYLASDFITQVQATALRPTHHAGRSQLVRHDHVELFQSRDRGRRVVRSRVLLLFQRAHRRDRQSFAGWNLGAHDRVRSELRLHGDGAHLFAYRAH